MGKMSLTSCRALSTPGKFSNVDRYAIIHFHFLIFNVSRLSSLQVQILSKFDCKTFGSRENSTTSSAYHVYFLPKIENKIDPSTNR